MSIMFIALINVAIEIKTLAQNPLNYIVKIKTTSQTLFTFALKMKDQNF